MSEGVVQVHMPVCPKKKGCSSMVKVISGKRVGKLGRLAVGCSATIFDPTKRKGLRR
jgi:hypothetical protein